MDCMVCGTPNIEKFLSLGKTALANSYPLKEDIQRKSEATYPLEVFFCNKCKTVQLGYVVPAEILFKHYLYVTSTSHTFRLHFEEMARSVVQTFGLSESSLVVDIGSNDGLLLKSFQKFGIKKTIGVEPATNIAKMSQDDGIETINDFFTQEVAKHILSSKGRVDVVTANNVFAHTTSIHDIARNVKSLLADNGVFIIEVAYIGDMMRQMTFDAIYHEHLFYYSLTALTNLFAIDGMEVFKVLQVPSHGGSLRVFVKSKESKRPVETCVSALLEQEKKEGFADITPYKAFAERVYDTRNSLIECITSIKRDNHSIAGYGAPAKATTLLNFCGLGAEFIDYVVDDSPLKQGRFIPGMQIPIVNAAMLDKKQPEYVIILAWNVAEEILKKTKYYADKGTKFIIPLPHPVIV